MSLIDTLSPSDKNFIKTHLSEKAENLLFKTNQPENIKVLVEQIIARQKIKEKLPSWHQNLDLILPKSISLEQSSSEKTAQYKAEIMAGDTLIDLTGGMGVDFFACSKGFKAAIYVEQNNVLAEITSHNGEVWGVKNTQFHIGNCVEYLTNYSGKATWVYLDPARRSAAGNKVSYLADCEPNILKIKQLLLSKAENVLLKCSPMLDIDLAIKELENVCQVFILCLNNEVKELLFHIKTKETNSINAKVVHFKNGFETAIDFDLVAEKNLNYKLSKPLKYLYEPNAGIMKAGAFRSISEKYGCPKLHQNTHLYTSEAIIENFPGRIFEIIATLKPDKKEILKYIPSLKANLTIRNFPSTVDQLRKQLNLKDGGNEYLFACTNNFNQKIILQTKKIN
jgi:16S rRNA G966 N2-methylase RsmD